MNSSFEKLLSEPDKKLNAAELAYMSACLRKLMFTVLHEKGTGHWGGASSAAELVTSLYFGRMNIDPANPEWEDRDRFILSKGHASVNLYTVLGARGYFPLERVHEFRTLGSDLQGHPAMLKLEGVDFSTGALGHGLSVGLGMALAAKLSGKSYKTYVLTGEGCLNEGSSWEALMCAAKYKVENLVLMIDYNRVQLDGTEAEIMPLDPLKEKLESFGWHVNSDEYDGNNTSDILRSYEWMDSDNIWPKAVIYNTVKGKCVSFSEGKNSWHGAKVDDEHYELGCKDLDEDIRKKEAAL